MTFENESQLKSFLLGKCVESVANAEKRIYEEFAGSLNQFYSEFRPEEYIRTGELFNSLKSTGVIRTSNGAMAEVGFVTPSWKHGWIPLQSGNYGYSSWSDKKIFDVVMTGSYSGLPHGGYEEGTAIWNESMERLGGKSGIAVLLRQELKRQGL